MTRYLVNLTSRERRQYAHKLIDDAPYGARFELKHEKRTTDQNSMMWALLSDVALQKTHGDRRYTPDQWKVLFMHACGREVQFIPSLDGTTFIPWGNRSSDLSKQEMTDLIEFILAWGAQNGVVFKADEIAA